jgi:hypothetical protein
MLETELMDVLEDVMVIEADLIDGVAIVRKGESTTSGYEELEK